MFTIFFTKYIGTYRVETAIIQDGPPELIPISWHPYLSTTVAKKETALLSLIAFYVKHTWGTPLQFISLEDFISDKHTGVNLG